MKYKYILPILAAVFGLVTSKDHFKVEEDMKPDHKQQRVGYGRPEKNENCIYKNDLTDDKLCVISQGSSSAGYRWKQEFQAYSADIKQGHYSVDVQFYLKLAFKIQPEIILTRLMENLLEIDMNQFEAHHTSKMTYHMYSNDLCFDIYSEIEPIEIDVMQTLRFVECSKNIIDNVFDFGQHSDSDSSYTKKLLSPFGKYFDDCRLQHDATATLKQIKPFDEVSYKVIDTTIADGEAYKLTTNKFIRIIRWIGSGSQLPDAYCFPGNIIRWIYLLEKATVTAAPGPLVQSSEDNIQDSFAHNFIRPYLEIGMIKLMQWIHESTKDMEGQDQRHTVLEHVW